MKRNRELTDIAGCLVQWKTNQPLLLRINDGSTTKLAAPSSLLSTSNIPF